MHKNLYNIQAAFFCSENLIKSLEEVKSFLGFKLHKINDIAELYDVKYDVLVIDTENKKKLSLDKVTIPKILVTKNKENIDSKLSYNLVVTFPINLLKFNQTVIDFSQKYKFDKNSLIEIKNYILDKNERTLSKNEKKIKITEKEIDFIEILFSSKKPLNKNFILENVWKYSKGTDTHTVETHIYRLRQKIKNYFNDENFIKNTKQGYSL
jgi:DNA-binding response OmpR family regulator